MLYYVHHHFHTGDNHNSATIALRDSLDGPQQVHLELTLRLTTNGAFSGKYIANLMVGMVWKFFGKFKKKLDFLCYME